MLLLPSLALLAPAHASDTAPSAPDETAPPAPDAAACFARHAAALSTDEMGGRGVGTPGLARAADYVAAEMKRLGLGAPVKDYRQAFQVTTGVALGEGNQLDDGAPRALGTDWTPAGFSKSATVSGEAVFVGYGISAPDLGYDDYAGLDVKGKVVLALRFEPGEGDDKSPFDGKRATRFSDLRTKAIRAREAGAAALVLVSPANAPDEPDKLPPLKVNGPQSDAGIPVLFVTRAVADAWLAKGGTSVAQAREAIDTSYRPASRPLGASVRLTTAVTPTRAETWNVVGTLPGKGKLGKELVVLGAHYDHLGTGGHGSFRPDSHEVHNGADDNASGVAAILCAAERLAKSKGDRRTIVIAAFSAEEIGLGGSAAYVEAPAVRGKVTAMVNLDMVGRLRDGKLSVLGADSSTDWAALLAQAGPAAPELTVSAGGDGYGPSDQTSFYAAGSPVVHLFTGAHEQYHTPDDDAPLLNTAGGGAIVNFTVALVDAAARTAAPLAYVKSNGGPMAGDSRGYGAYFGSVPDYATMEAKTGGVRLSDVRGGSPAEKAGLRKGDVIVSMAGMDVQNLYDMTYVLREHRPGETIEVVVMRDGQRVALAATLAQRTGDGKPPSATAAPPAENPPPKDVPELLRPEETHLADLRRLTFGGDNAEAYWGPDGRRLILQRTPRGGTCDQEYLYDLDAGKLTLHSSGKGRTTCGYYDHPKGDTTIYATTEAASPECPPKPDHSQGYVWAIYDTFDIVRQDAAGKTTPWLPSPGYDAEATVCPVDGRVIFTSTRNGDLDLYIANADGSNLRQVTNTAGYDGGAFFTPDCKRIVWRASRPTGDALADYQRLLKQGLVRPSNMEIFVMDLDAKTGVGKNIKQLTSDGVGSFAPYPTPDGKGVLYSSNRGGSPREFDIWYVPFAGGTPTRVTTAPGFDGFPMFSPDGKWLVFSSNRANKEGETDTDVYVARWVP